MKKQSTNQIIIYTISSNKASRETIEFFKENQVDYIEQNVLKEPLSKSVIQYLFYRADRMEKLLAKKSKGYKELQTLLNDDDVRMSDIYQFIQENPRVLKYPIVLDQQRLMVGYNEHNIRTFLPRKMKQQYFHRTLEKEKRQEVSFVS